MDAAEFADFIAKSDAVKNLDDGEFGELMDEVETLGPLGIGRCVEIAKSISASLQSLKLRAKLLLDRMQSDNGEESSVAAALKSKLERAAEGLKGRGFAVSGVYMELQKRLVGFAVKSAEAFDTAMDGRRNREVSMVETLAYEIDTGLLESRGEAPVGLGTRRDQMELLRKLAKEVGSTSDKNTEEIPGDIKEKIGAIDAEMSECLERQKSMPKTCVTNVEKSLYEAQERLAEAMGKLKSAVGDDKGKVRLVERVEKLSESVDRLQSKFLKASCDRIERELITTKVSLCRERKRPLEEKLERVKSADADAAKADRRYVDALKWAERKLGIGGARSQEVAKDLEELIPSMEAWMGGVGVATPEQAKAVREVVDARLKMMEAAGRGEDAAASVEAAIEMLQSRLKKMRQDLRQMPKCTAASKARYEAQEALIKEYSANAGRLVAFLGMLRSEAQLYREDRIKALKSIADALESDGEVLVKADSAIKWLKQNTKTFK